MEFIIEFLVQFVPFVFLNENGDKDLTKKGKIVLVLSSIVICVSIFKAYAYFIALGWLFAILGFALVGLIIFALLKILNNNKQSGRNLSIIYVLINAILLYMSKSINNYDLLFLCLTEVILLIAIYVIDINDKKLQD